MRRGLRAVLVGLVMAGGACAEEVCTLVGCAAEPWIRVIDDGTEGGHLRAGDYLFRLRSAAVTLEWTCALASDGAPDPGCDRSSLTAAGEIEGEPVEWVVTATHAAGGLAVELVERREDGRIVAGPEEFTITVIRGGVVQIESTQRPEYAGSWPNGVECGPYCAAATEPVVVHLPA